MPKQMLAAADAVRSSIGLGVAVMRAVYTKACSVPRAEASNILAIFVLSAQRHWRVWQNSHTASSGEPRRPHQARSRRTTISCACWASTATISWPVASAGRPRRQPNGMTSRRARIAEAHGGRMWATANRPRGAVFRFTCRPNLRFGAFVPTDEPANLKEDGRGPVCGVFGRHFRLWRSRRRPCPGRQGS
jgi:hypothetical protein